MSVQFPHSYGLGISDICSQGTTCYCTLTFLGEAQLWIGSRNMMLQWWCRRQSRESSSQLRLLLLKSQSRLLLAFLRPEENSPTMGHILIWATLSTQGELKVHRWRHSPLLEEDTERSWNARRNIIKLKTEPGPRVPKKSTPWLIHLIYKLLLAVPSKRKHFKSSVICGNTF